VAQFLPVLAMIVLAIIFALASLVVSRALSRKSSNAAKLAPYECGILPSRDAPERFPVSFYLVAMLFIMFDIEIVFLYPYVVAQEALGTSGFAAIISFSLVFFLAFVYVVAKGGIDWGPVRQVHRAWEAVSPTRTAATTVRRVGTEGREEAA
jgi:NADH-quinone oxidoreductase subunit A